MISHNPLSDRVSVGAQVRAEDLTALFDAGFRSIINNRPDDEEPGQPTSSEMAAQAREAGLRYHHVPVRGLPDDHSVAEVAETLRADAAAGSSTFMFCRSGMRSVACWAMAQRLDGADADELRISAAKAGYDLSRLPL